VSSERLDAYLRALVDARGSDLHVKVGSPPRIRVDGVLRRLDDEFDLAPEDTAGFAAAVMPPKAVARFGNDGFDADFAYAVPASDGSASTPSASGGRWR